MPVLAPRLAAIALALVPFAEHDPAGGRAPEEAVRKSFVVDVALELERLTLGVLHEAAPMYPKGVTLVARRNAVFVDRAEPGTDPARVRRRFLEVDVWSLEDGPPHTEGGMTITPSRTERCGSSALESREIAFTPGEDEECDARFVDGERPDTSLLWNVCDPADLRGFLPPRRDDTEWRVPVEALRGLLAAGGELDVLDQDEELLPGEDVHAFVRALEGSMRASVDEPWGTQGPRLRTIRLAGDLEGRIVADRDRVTYAFMYPADASRTLRADLEAELEGALTWDVALDRAVALDLEGRLEVHQAATYRFLDFDSLEFEELEDWSGTLALRARFCDDEAPDEER